MKKKIICFVLLATVIAILALGSGCGKKEIIYNFENDGVYKYYYVSEEDSYAIVGLVEESEDNVLYIPPFFKGKPVTRIGYILKKYANVIYLSSGDPFRIEIPQEKLYYSYNSFLVDDLDVHAPVADKVYIPRMKVEYRLISHCLYHDIYVCSPVFADLIEEAKYNYGILMTEKNRIQQKNGEDNNFIYPANTSYFFNYENAPNENCFFINDFERGGLIENTPYEPTREGYEFAGWYKEPECINAWDFAVDILPEPEYDEDGDLIFVETKLYAKWIKL